MEGTLLKLLSVSLIACIAAPVAFAADLPTKKAPPAPFVAPPPAFSWTGWYFGATAGLAHSNNNLKAAAVAGTNINALAAGAARAIGDIDADQYSFTGGVEGGYNYQYGNLVLGAEADVEYIGGRRTQDTGNLNYGGVTIREINTVGSDWLATVRARLGYAVVDRMLVYATGGVAFADMTFNRQLNWSFVDGCAIVGGLNPVITAARRRAWVGPWAQAPNMRSTATGRSRENFSSRISASCRSRRITPARRSLRLRLCRPSIIGTTTSWKFSGLASTTDSRRLSSEARHPGSRGKRVDRNRASVFRSCAIGSDEDGRRHGVLPLWLARRRRCAHGLSRRRVVDRSRR